MRYKRFVPPYLQYKQYPVNHYCQIDQLFQELGLKNILELVQQNTVMAKFQTRGDFCNKGVTLETEPVVLGLGL